MSTVQDRLRAPFQVEDVEFKPAVVSGNRALALAYADARVFMDRLDEVLGVGGWSTAFEKIGEHSVKCRLTCKIEDEWVAKEDVGATSDQPDAGDKMKAAFSDALKRACVQYGIGRYLYNLPQTWADYDPKNRQFLKPPTLPSWAIPAPKEPPKGKVAQAAQLQAIKESTRNAIKAKCEENGFKLSQILEAIGCTPFKQLADTTEEVGQKILAYLEQLMAKEPV